MTFKRSLTSRTRGDEHLVRSHYIVMLPVVSLLLRQRLLDVLIELPFGLDHRQPLWLDALVRNPLYQIIRLFLRFYFAFVDFVSGVFLDLLYEVLVAQKDRAVSIFAAGYFPVFCSSTPL